MPSAIVQEIAFARGPCVLRLISLGIVWYGACSYLYGERGLLPENRMTLVRSEITTMKSAVLTLCLFFSGGAFAQAGIGALSAEPYITEFPTHDSRAEQKPMGREENLLGSINGFSHERGERPLWEFASTSPSAMPLGDAARMLKKAHQADKKAAVVWQNF